LRRYGCPSQKLPIVSRQANERKKLDGQDRKPKPHEVGLQVPRRIYTEESKDGVVRSTADASWRGLPQIGAAQGEPDRGGTFDGRSRSHDDLDTAEICGVDRGGVYQGQKCDSLGSGVCRAQAELYRAKFLGARVFCVDRRSR